MSRLSSKNQITIPSAVMREAGLRPGDQLQVRAAGPGRVQVERAEDLVARFAGTLSGVYPEGYLDELRDEWRR